MSQEVKLVNLAEFTKRHYGFQETEKSTKNSPCLKNPAGDVIVVKYQQNGVNTFFCPKDNQKGDIYNFVMWQEHCDFKTAAAKIDNLLGLASIQGNPIPQEKRVAKVFDVNAAAQLKPVQEHAYLESRGIDNAMLIHGRFRGTVLTDEYHNAVFPHCRHGKIVGYVKKNYKFNGFSEGGEKLLWKSNQFPGDTRLCVTEAAIDALSLAVLMRDSPKHAEQMYHTRFVSIDGGYSPEAEAMLKQEVAALPRGSVIEAAFDNDEQGRRYCEKLANISMECGQVYAENIPSKRKDWNEVLQAYLKREAAKAQVAAAYPRIPATPPSEPRKISQKQRGKIRGLIKNGYLTPIPEEKIDRMTGGEAWQTIAAGMERARKKETVPGYTALEKEAEEEQAPPRRGMHM